MEKGVKLKDNGREKRQTGDEKDKLLGVVDADRQ
jgi:hypothetical protein